MLASGYVRPSFSNSNSSNGNGTKPSFDFSLQSLKFGRLEHGNHVGAVETKSLAAFSQDARHNDITEQNTTQSAVCDTGGGLERSAGGGHEYQPLASRPSILSSPRLNSRPASAPHYPRDDSSEDIPSPRFVPAEKYQLQVHQTAALAMNSGNWQKLMVTADGSYQKQEPWSPAWIESRGLIRAWLEFQAQSDEDLRAVKEFPGVRQHTHHNEVSITQQKHLPASFCVLHALDHQCLCINQLKLYACTLNEIRTHSLDDKHFCHQKACSLHVKKDR